MAPAGMKSLDEIIALRYARNLSQADLARLTGTKQSGIFAPGKRLA